MDLKRGGIVSEREVTDVIDGTPARDRAAISCEVLTVSPRGWPARAVHPGEDDRAAVGIGEHDEAPPRRVLGRPQNPKLAWIVAYFLNMQLQCR
jgi:hypothetical protein